MYCWVELHRVIHVDNGYLGGYGSDVRDSGSSGKKYFINALSFYKYKPFHLKLSTLTDLCKVTIRLWSIRIIAQGSLVFSDALQDPLQDAIQGGGGVLSYSCESCPV